MKILTHKSISFLKSAIRLAASAFILATTISAVVWGCFGLLFLAELIGVVEEFMPDHLDELIEEEVTNGTNMISEGGPVHKIL